MIVDETNILTEYGAVLLQNSYSSLVTYPSLKEPLKNEWAEYQGIEVDLAEPKVNAREITLNLCVDNDKLDDFIDFLYTTSIREWEFPVLNKTFNLRFVGASDLEILENKSMLKIKLSEDGSFLDGYSYVKPSFDGAYNAFKMDLADLSIYGVTILKGTKDSYKEPAKPKSILNISNRIINGGISPNIALKKSSKTATMSCLIHLPIEDFWDGYNAFLYDLTKSGLRTFSSYKVYRKAYYKNSNVEEFSISDGKIWCKFKVSLEFVNDDIFSFVQSGFVQATFVD